jgi:YVTN family beta-propeller protein
VDLASSSAINTINVASRDDGEEDSPDGIVVSPDGKTVYVSTNEGLSVIKAATAAVTNVSTGTPCYTSDLALSPNAQTLYDATAFGFLVISAKTHKVIARIPESYDYNSDQIALTPDGETIFLTNGSGTVQVISTATNSVTTTISDANFGELAGVAVSPSGKSAYVTDGSSDTVHVLTPVAMAPKITSKGSVTFKVGAKGTFTVTTSGYPTPAVTESGTMPAGVTFKNNGNGTATLSGTPASGTGKAYTLTLSASNGAGAPASQSFRLAVDQEPKITSAAKVTFTYKKKKKFTVTTTGYPAAAITEAGALPPGLKFVNNKNGTATISGTPTLKASKTYAITLRASNGVAPAATLKFHLILRK